MTRVFKLHVLEALMDTMVRGEGKNEYVRAMEMEMEMEMERMLRPYIKPIFGFALKRVKNRAVAEDLAQEIMLQLISSITHGAGIRNWDAYI